MTTTPGADEQRTRHNLRIRGVSYTPQPPANARQRDWLDDLWADDPDAPAARPQSAAPPAPPPAPKRTAQDADEPRWDWRRLLHWPHARPVIAASVALAATALPVPRVGYSAATTWAYAVHQVRADHGAGWGYTVGGGAFALAGWLVAQRGRRTGVLRLTLLAVTLVGLTGAFSWFDLITFATGVTK